MCPDRIATVYTGVGEEFRVQHTATAGAVRGVQLPETLFPVRSAVYPPKNSGGWSSLCEGRP